MKYLILLVSLLISNFTFAQSSYSESDYADYIQSLIGGEREVTVEGGRVDLVTNEYAFEIEWAHKWKNAIGQSLWYALQTNKKPGIIIIIKSNDEYKYFVQLNSALSYAGLDEKVKVFLFPNDFEELMGEGK